MDWISVNDNLPDHEFDVVVWAYGIDIGCYYPDSKEWVIYSEDDEPRIVTHWMHLNPPNQ